MSRHEIDRFVATWNFEAKRTADLLRSLPTQQYDFRPEPKWRSIGEMAWHLAEIDAYTTAGIEKGFDFGEKPPGIERPLRRTSPLGTSSTQPPLALFSRQPPARSVTPRQVT